MSELMTRVLSDVKPEPVSWLWPGRIPRGKVTLIAGDPGLGKSFLTMDIAARVTRGGSSRGDWPDGQGTLRAPGEVLVLNAEDDAADTLLPRLIAAGGDPSKVRFVEGVDRDNEPTEGFFALDRDEKALASMLRRMNAPRLVIIDPISAYMGGVDTHRNADVRAVLAKLSRIAAACNVAIVCVTHLSKGGENQSKRAVHRLMGSLAFAAAARMVWMVGVHPDDPEQRVLSLVKSNLAATRTGLSFQVKNEPGGSSNSARIVFADVPFVGTADMLEDPQLAERVDAVQEATSFLQELLKAGPCGAQDVLKQARDAGISEITLRRAKRALNVSVTKPGGPSSGWVWSSTPTGQTTR